MTDEKQITIMNDYVFGSVMVDEKKLKPLIERILDVSLDDIQIVNKQQVLDAHVIGAKGIRLDVLCIDGDGNRFDVEVEVRNRGNLPKRTRMYHSLSDRAALGEGEDYNLLKKSYVIFICGFDLIGTGEFINTFEMRCVEHPEMRLEDESFTVFVNTRGTSGTVSPALKNVIEYFAKGKTTDEYTKSLDQAVENLKADKGWRDRYMSYEGMLLEQKNYGEYVRVARQIRKNYSKRSADDLAEVLDISPDECSQAIEVIKRNPEWNDEEVASNVHWHAWGF